LRIKNIKNNFFDTKIYTIEKCISILGGNGMNLIFLFL